MRTVRLVCAICFLPAVCCSFNAQDRKSADTQVSCQTFVQMFYDWYLPKALNPDTDALSLAMQERLSSFSPALVKQVKDARTEMWRREEVFLDFDPILNTQDPSGKRYLVQNATEKGGRCWAQIFGKYSGRSAAKTPDVIAELAMKNDRWLFVDFHYPDSHQPDNKSLVLMLRRILRGAKKERPKE